MTAEQDEGRLVVVGQSESPAGKALATIAKAVADRAGGKSISLPVITG
jgi:hypothetical protein